MILGLEAANDLSVDAHLESLMTMKNDLLADVEYLAQTVDYQTF